MSHGAAVRSWRQDRKELQDRQQPIWLQSLAKYAGKSKEVTWLLSNIPTPETVVPDHWGDDGHVLKGVYIKASLKFLEELGKLVDIEDALILEEAFPSSELFNHILQHFAIPFTILQKYNVQNRWRKYEDYKSIRTFFDVQPHLKDLPDEVQAWFVHGPRKYTLELYRDYFAGDEYGFYIAVLNLSIKRGFVGLDDKELQKVGLSFSRLVILRKDLSKIEKLLYENSSHTRELLKLSQKLPTRIDRLISLLEQRAYYKSVYDSLPEEESY